MITTNEWLEMLGVERKKKLEGADVTQKNPQELLGHLQNFSPLEFEEFVRKFFVAIGYTNARTTPRSYDGGIDVFASRLNMGQEEEIVAQCKRTEVVGVEVARELMGILAANPRISKGFLVTNGRISKACKKFCESNGRLTWIDGVRLTEYAARLNLEI